MVKGFILADDLTGSNAVAVLLHNIGLSAVTVLDADCLTDRVLLGDDSIVCDAGTRLLPPCDAASRVQDIVSGVVRRLDTYQREVTFSKRIDSTLRGQLGSEIEAYFRVLPPNSVAALVPVFPASGRIVENGVLYVHGVPLHQTEINQDPTHPMLTSDVANIVEQQTNLPVSWVRTEGISLEVLCNTLVQMIREGKRIVGCDAKTDEDIARLAKAWLMTEQRTGVLVLPVDPGPFTSALLSLKNEVASCNERRKVLVVSGSIMGTAQKQLEYLLQRSKSKVFAPTFVIEQTGTGTDEFVSTRDGSNLFSEIVENAQMCDVVVIRTDARVVSSAWEKRRLLDEIANTVKEVMLSGIFGGLYVCGGETASCVLGAMGVQALRVKKEIAPLCVMSTVLGGRFDGLNVVTKGGAVGGESTVLDSVNALSRY